MWMMGCRPNYPNCENSDHCVVEGQAPGVCVNGFCQECLEDSDCTANRGDTYYCNAGRCDERVTSAKTCESHGDCGTDEHCQDKQCVAGAAFKAAGEACAQNAECGPASTCFAGTCTLKDKLAQTCGKFLPQPDNTTNSGENNAIIVFEFNDHALTAVARNTLQETAKCMQKIPTKSIVIEGHSDDRGTQEYNLALGEKRASSVRKYLAALGVGASQLRTRSKGENEPRCFEGDEGCWALNRRVEFLFEQQR